MSAEWLGSLWTGMLTWYLEPRSLLRLASTCHVFHKLFQQQPFEFWYQLCIRADWHFPVSLIAHSRNIFTAGVVDRCFVCHKPARTVIPRLVCVSVCLLCSSPFPVVTATEAKKQYHLKPATLARLTRVSSQKRRARYYLVCDVRTAAIVQYGSEEKWRAVELKAEQRKRKRRHQLSENRCLDIEQNLAWMARKLGPGFAPDGKPLHPIACSYIESGNTDRWYALDSELCRRQQRHLWKALTPADLEVLRSSFTRFPRLEKTSLVKTLMKDCLWQDWTSENPNKMAQLNRLVRTVSDDDSSSSRDASPTRQPE